MSESKLPGEAVILDIASQNIHRCLACDVCPTHIDVDEKYRCIIKAKSDHMADFQKCCLSMYARIHEMVVCLEAL